MEYEDRKTWLLFGVFYRSRIKEESHSRVSCIKQEVWRINKMQVAYLLCAVRVVLSYYVSRFAPEKNICSELLTD
jgi:hypothetical protein